MDRTDGIGNCSITVHLRQTQQVSGGGVLFEACRVGSVNEDDGRMILNWNMGELTRIRPSESTKQLIKRLSEAVTESGKETEIQRAVTSEEGTCTFSGLEEGAWLLHAADSSSYGTIEDTLVAVPCYVEVEHTWEGPVYDADVWPKGVIIPKAEESKTQIKETEKEKVPPEENTFQIEKTPVRKVTVSETEKGTTPDMTTLQRTQEKTPQSESVFDSETIITRKGRKSPVPERTQTPSRQVTQQNTQPVRTLDNTPLSGLICAFLGCALLIVMILSRWRRKGRKNRIRHLAFIAGTGILLSSGSVVRTAGEESGSFEEMLSGERKIVFVNHSPDAPCLSVTKEVLDALNGSRAPEGDVFVFRLTLNGTRASQVKYRVFDSYGEELVDLTGSGGADLVPASSVSSDPVRLKTGRDGSFSLRGSQTALFEDVSAGDLWEVTELDQDHYERIVPMSSATLSGSVESTGSLARFVNRYVSEEEPDLTQGTIEITKKILWPEQIAMPQRGRFRIRVVADGQPLGGVQVELCDLEDGSPLFYETTDEKGCFEIEGNQRSVIHVPSGSDVYVEEIDDPDDLFVPSGAASWKGSVSSLSRITFTNRLADFVVAKSLHSGDRQHSFEFCLLGPDERPLESVPYYLTDEDGVLETAAPLFTDEDGHFSLRADQRAVFTGLAEGSRYSVREEKHLGYRQITPSEEGYSYLTVKNGIPVLSFENEKTDILLFAPSAGGPGIVMTLAAAIAGMVILWLFHDKRWKRGVGKRARLKKGE